MAGRVSRSFSFHPFSLITSKMHRAKSTSFYAGRPLLDPRGFDSCRHSHDPRLIPIMQNSSKFKYKRCVLSSPKVKQSSKRHYPRLECINMKKEKTKNMRELCSRLSLVDWGCQISCASLTVIASSRGAGVISDCLACV